MVSQGAAVGSADVIGGYLLQQAPGFRGAGNNVKGPTSSCSQEGSEEWGGQSKNRRG
jgi:hypothetical protein